MKEIVLYFVEVGVLLQIFGSSGNFVEFCNQRKDPNGVFHIGYLNFSKLHRDFLISNNFNR